MQCYKKDILIDHFMQNPIWQFIDSRQFGGIESHVQQLALALNKRQVFTKVVLFQMYDHHHPMVDALRFQGVEVEDCSGSLRALLAMIMEEKPALIHTHGYKAGLLGRLCGALCSKPIVSTFHAGEKSIGRVGLYDALDRYTAFLSDRSLAVSDLIASRILANASVVNNFVDTERCKKSDGKQVAFVGRLSQEKGADRLIELADSNTTQSIHVYGDGPLMSVLRSAKRENLVLHGSVKNMDEVWPNIQLLIMPSRYEGLPLSAIEAMAHHIPVVAFNVGGLDRLIKNGINGWLIEPGNLQKMSLSINNWTASNGRLKSVVGTMARQIVEDEFSCRAVLPFYQGLYGQLTKKYADVLCSESSEV